MYFSLSYEFAKIFALNYDLKQVAYIGEYTIALPQNTLILDFDREQLLLNKPDYEKYDAILIKNRELCLKQEQQLNLNSFSIITRNGIAKEIFISLKVGNLENEDELTNIPASLINDVTEIINNLI